MNYTPAYQTRTQANIKKEENIVIAVVLIGLIVSLITLI